jgi:hypothetical protein
VRYGHFRAPSRSDAPRWAVRPRGRLYCSHLRGGLGARFSVSMALTVCRDTSNSLPATSAGFTALDEVVAGVLGSRTDSSALPLTVAAERPEWGTSCVGDFLLLSAPIFVGVACRRRRRGSERGSWIACGRSRIEDGQGGQERIACNASLAYRICVNGPFTFSWASRGPLPRFLCRVCLHPVEWPLGCPRCQAWPWVRRSEEAEVIH